MDETTDKCKPRSQFGCFPCSTSRNIKGKGKKLKRNISRKEEDAKDDEAERIRLSSNNSSINNIAGTILKSDNNFISGERLGDTRNELMIETNRNEKKDTITEENKWNKNKESAGSTTKSKTDQTSSPGNVESDQLFDGKNHETKKENRTSHQGSGSESCTNFYQTNCVNHFNNATITNCIFSDNRAQGGDEQTLSTHDDKPDNHSAHNVSSDEVNHEKTRTRSESDSKEENFDPSSQVSKSNQNPPELGVWRRFLNIFRFYVLRRK